MSPDVALDALVRRQEADLTRQVQELAAHKAAAAAAVAEYGRSDTKTAEGNGERLIGIDAIEAKLESLAKDVRLDCLSVMPGGAQSQASLDASRPLDMTVLEREVKILTLYQDSVRNDPASETMVVPIDSTDTRAGALCTREHAIVASLTAVFDRAWASAVPLGADRACNESSGLSASNREMLLLLAQGLTHEAVAKRLGVGLRTVSRQMSGLMERLDASSRFEAGLRAAQRGGL